MTCATYIQLYTQHTMNENDGHGAARSSLQPDLREELRRVDLAAHLRTMALGRQRGRTL